MKTYLRFVTRAMAPATLAALMVAAPVPALSQSNMDQSNIGQDSTGEEMANRQQRLRAHVQARLDDMAKRLQIDARQQDAWNEYAKAVQSTLDMRSAKPPAEADAAEILRFRANQAGSHAQKMNQMADAAAKLQEALRPEQRKVLSEIVRQQGRSPDDRQKRYREGEPYGQ